MTKKNPTKIDCDNEVKILSKTEADCVSLSVLWLCAFIYKWGWNGNIPYKCPLICIVVRIKFNYWVILKCSCCKR